MNILPLVRIFNDEYTPDWIRRFDHLGVFAPVDSVHDLEWLKKEVNHEYAFGVTKEMEIVAVKELKELPSILFITMPHDNVKELVMKIVSGDLQMTEYFLKGFITEKKENHVEPIISMAPEVPDIETPYCFTSRYLDSYDVKLYEVIRPGTETPFVVLVENFSQKSDIYFFTDIYGSNAWDCNRRECRFDFLFLQSLWHHMKFDGDFTMDVLKKRVDSCYPGIGIVAESEPIVYRNTIDAVEKIIKQRRVPRK